MRAVLSAERVRSNCNINARNYSKQNDQINDSATTIKSKPAKETEVRLVGKLVSYVNSWINSFQPEQIQEHKNIAKVSEVTEELQQREPQKLPKIKRITITRNPSTKPENPANLLTASFASFSAPNLKVVPEANVEDSQKLSQLKPLSKTKQKDTLLAYPVVPLKETLDRYLSSIRPFFKENAFQKQQELTRDFLHNKGHELQVLLQDAGTDNINWLTDRWTKATYLRHRAPLTVFSSPCITFPKQNFRNVLEFLDFTAKAIYGMCEFMMLVENNQLPIYSMNGYELDNSQFHNVFGTVRIPQRSRDVLQQCASNYVTVIHRNNFYKLPVFTADKRILSIIQLRKQLLEVLRSERHKGPPIGLLTHDTRDNWSEAHEMLCRKEVNDKSVACIEQALFTISLDEPIEVPVNQERSTQAAQLLHGGGMHLNSANRWMDKTLQLIVNPNGMAGICYEQAPADPQPAATIMDYVQNNITNPNYGLDCGGPSEELEYLPFEEESECIDFWLSAAERSIQMISKQLKMHAFQFDCYGKRLIKTQGLPPDSYIQMALQLAFYRQHKELPAQQETAHLRIFKFGREETIRSTSSESLNFIRAMVSKNATPTSRLQALIVAVDYHKQQTKLAMQGLAVDRHLFGLKQMARENAKPLPYFFYSDGYVKSSHFRIVSSQLTTPHDAFMARGPLNSEGYGCCYNLRENDINFALSAWQQNPKLCAVSYGGEIESTLVEMGQLIMETSRR